VTVSNPQRLVRYLTRLSSWFRNGAVFPVRQCIETCDNIFNEVDHAKEPGGWRLRRSLR
jgi:hypothetical protein